jgi:hypothetical protein
MSPEDAKRYNDRARVIQSFIDEERARCVALIKKGLDDWDFLLYCIVQSYTVNEIKRARELYDQSRDDLDIEDMM